jgi:PadR family transcriptional regulator, regulatory protein PadR
MADRTDLPQGTLETMILKTLSWGEQHGYGIGRWIERASGDSLTIEEGSLYPALHRMEKRGWITATWRLTENNRRGKYYELTREGREQLRVQSGSWQRVMESVAKVLETTSQAV